MKFGSIFLANSLNFKYFMLFVVQSKINHFLCIEKNVYFSSGYLFRPTRLGKDFVLTPFVYTLLENNLSIFLFYFMNIYVGNLSYKVRENDLQGVIEEYGQVESCKIIKDRETGKSKGFAFVEMADDAAATKAIEELNGAEFDGRTMVVKEARPRN